MSWGEFQDAYKAPPPPPPPQAWKGGKLPTGVTSSAAAVPAPKPAQKITSSLADQRARDLTAQAEALDRRTKGGTRMSADDAFEQEEVITKAKTMGATRGRELGFQTLHASGAEQSGARHKDPFAQPESSSQFAQSAVDLANATARRNARAVHNEQGVTRDMGHKQAQKFEGKRAKSAERHLRGDDSD